MPHKQSMLPILFCCLPLIMACIVSTYGGGNATTLSQQAYWACATATPIPTHEIIVGYETHFPEVGAGTPTPEPETITLYGFTTPVPTETPYYRIGSFYEGQPAQIGNVRITLVSKDIRLSSEPNSVDNLLIFKVDNIGSSPTILPLSQLIFVREVETEHGVINGRFAHTDSVAGNSLSETEQLPLQPNESRSLLLGIRTPVGQIETIGLGTDWLREVEGGTPIWFLPKPDEIPCPHGNSLNAPTPTPKFVQTGSSLSGLHWPTSGALSHAFGCTPFDTGTSGMPYGCFAAAPYFHLGLDIADASGTAVFSPIAGTVIRAGVHSEGPDCSGMIGSLTPHTGYGNMVQISNGQQIHLLAHLQTISVTLGQTIEAGTPIGQMGSTGCSTGTHLHWECLENGVLTNPALC